MVDAVKLNVNIAFSEIRDDFAVMHECVDDFN